MKGVCIFQTIYMSIWGCMHFAYGTKHIKICPFQTGQLLKETDYNGATLRDKEKAEKSQLFFSDFFLDFSLIDL